MSRYIDADALTKTITDNMYVVSDMINSRDCGMFWTGGIERAINEAPSIDIVRCGECKHWNHEEELTYCDKTVWFGTDADDFCSYGERRA